MKRLVLSALYVFTGWVMIRIFSGTHNPIVIGHGTETGCWAIWTPLDLPPATKLPSLLKVTYNSHQNHGFASQW